MTVYTFVPFDPSEYYEIPAPRVKPEPMEPDISRLFIQRARFPLDFPVMKPATLTVLQKPPTQVFGLKCNSSTIYFFRNGKR